MTPAQTNEQREEKKYTRIRKEKKKVESKAQNQKQEYRTQEVHTNKVSRLCYEAEPRTLSHLYAIVLLSSATVSSVNAAAVEPPIREQINENQAKLPGL